jgi:D-tyrosyl-tRNA(Tyr) deacylase
MRVLIQRVSSSQVSVDSMVIGKIGRGLNLLVGISTTDTEIEVDWMVSKCLDLRLFPNLEGDKFDLSIRDIGGEILVVSQFTLYADCQKGRRPSLSLAAPPAQAEQLYLKLVDKLRASGLTVETGEFGANMQVAISNDGPVTILLERESTTK